MRLVIKVTISTSSTSSENTQDIANNLDTLIRNKAYTSISHDQYTSLLDEEYGLQENCKIIVSFVCTFFIAQLIHRLFFYSKPIFSKTIGPCC